MKKLIGITGIVAGILLIIVPRYILPACEFADEGLSRMYCTATADAELMAGALFIIAGAATLLLKTETTTTTTAGAVAVFALSIVSFLLPDQFGFCRSPKMPCNYGMVPGIRFIAFFSAVVAILALGARLRNYRRKGKA